MAGVTIVAHYYKCDENGANAIALADAVYYSQSEVDADPEDEITSTSQIKTPAVTYNPVELSQASNGLTVCLKDSHVA